MQAKKPLTDRAIAALKAAPLGKRKIVWDALVPGFAVRVTDKGQRSFVLVTRYPGAANPASRAIGSVGAISLEDARARAREWLKLIGTGVDPTQQTASAAPDTLEAVCSEYLARDGAKLRSAEWVRRALERLVYPTLGQRPIASIRRSDIVRLLDQIEDERGPAMANRTLAILGRVMNWYAGRSDDFSSPIIRGMARRKQVARDRILNDDELRAVWRATSPISPGVSPVFAAFVRFLLLTSARRNEAAGMRWSEIAEGTWVLPAQRNKTGVELARPLSVAAKEIIEGLPRLCDFVFSRNGQAAMGGIAELKYRLDQASGVSGWRLHDLRRTSRTLIDSKRNSRETMDRPSWSLRQMRLR